MRVKLDENLSRHLKGTLTALGHDVLTVGDEGLLGRGDPEIGAAARTEERMLFTLDVEFADIRKYPPGGHPGIVLFRPARVGPLSVNHFVEAFVRAIDLDAYAGCVVVVGPHQVRVRRPHDRGGASLPASPPDS